MKDAINYSLNQEKYLQYVLENALDYKEVTDRKKLDELMPWSEKFKAWQHGKLMDNKAFSLNSDEKPYYRPSKDRIDIENDRINKNYCYRIPHMIKSYHQETKTNESQINTIKTTHQARRKLQWQITRTWNLMMI